MSTTNTKEKVALVTGITGQDGSYLTEFLLEKGYTVHGIIRRSSSFNTSRIDHLLKDRHCENVRLFLHYGDLTDTGSLIAILNKVKPTEVYNLGAQSHVRVSFDLPEYTAETDAIGVLRFLEAIRVCGMEHQIKFYQASTSELYGGSLNDEKQNEKTPFNPRSPYAAAKLYAYWMIVNYREAYNMFACNGVLFNHESPRRGIPFVTRKITRGVANIKLGFESCLYLGNLDARRDWGHAKEYVEAMWQMLQLEKPVDLVIATGETHSVREFAELAFGRVGMKLEWQGEGIDEVGIADEKIVVRIDPHYFRPTEVECLCGDPSLAESVLGWKPRTSFQELVYQMVDADLESVKKHQADHW